MGMRHGAWGMGCLRQGLPAREKNLLAFVQSVFPGAEGVDVGQAIGRCSKIWRKGERSFLPTLTTSTKMFLFGQHFRLLSGAEALMAQGFPIEQFRGLLADTNVKLLTDLAGNAMSAHVVLAVHAAMLLSVPWCKPKETAAELSTDEMLSALCAFTQSGDDPSSTSSD
eukprot:2243889-Pyramimonas_sp.AAC.1